MLKTSIQKQIQLADRTITYTLKISRLAKHLRLAIYCNGDLVVTQPRFVKTEIVNKFLNEKSDWILNKIANFKIAKKDSLSHLTRRDYLNNRARARELITERVEYFNCFYNFKYTQINIRDQKTRWGSCSKRGGLNFNFRLIYLADDVRDYFIIHELCHLKEFNHSANFWKLVSDAAPNFKDLRKKLKNGQLI